MILQKEVNLFKSGRQQNRNIKLNKYKAILFYDFLTTYIILNNTFIDKTFLKISTTIRVIDSGKITVM